MAKINTNKAVAVSVANVVASTEVKKTRGKKNGTSIGSIITAAMTTQPEVLEMVKTAEETEKLLAARYWAKRDAFETLWSPFCQAICDTVGRETAEKLWKQFNFTGTTPVDRIPVFFWHTGGEASNDGFLWAQIGVKKFRLGYNVPFESKIERPETQQRMEFNAATTTPALNMDTVVTL